jgi:hypothetical protein
LSAYIDTSIVAAYYCPEALSHAAERVLRRTADPVVSPLVEVELCSAIARKVRARELEAVAGNRILSLFRQHLEEGRFRTVELEVSHYRIAGDWLGRFATGLRTLDALHLAIAFARQLPIVSADKTLIEAARHFRIKHERVA